MSSQTAYCQNCKDVVPLQREGINWFLVVILAIFTSGIGLIFYFLIYINREENRCIYCDSTCMPKSRFEENEHQEQLITFKKKTPKEDLIPKRKGNFCPYCGSSVGDREGIVYCALCGNKMD